MDPREYRPVVVRRLLEGDLSPALLCTLIPEWSGLIESIARRLHDEHGSRPGADS